MALGRNVLANYIGQGLRALAGIVFVPLYVHYLGVESYGLIGIFGVLQAWLVLLDVGLRPALGREMARFTGGAHSAEWIRDLLRTVEVVVGLVAVAVAASVAWAAPWLARNWVTLKTLDFPTVTQAFVMMGVVTALSFVGDIYSSCLVGLQRQVLENIVSGVAAVVRGLGAIGVMVWVSPTIGAFFAWQCLLSICIVAARAGLVYWVLPATNRRARFSRTSLRSVYRFAVGMLVLTLESLLLSNLDKVVLSRVLPLEEFGRYALAGVAASVLGMFAQPVASALAPRFTQLATLGDDAELARVYHMGSQASSVLVGSAAVVLMTFSGRVLLLWTRDPTIAGPLATTMTLLVLGSFCNALMWVPYQLQLAHGWTSLSIKNNVIAVVLVVPALLFLVPRYGPVGAASVWVALNMTYVVVGLPLTHRRLLRGEMWRWYLVDTLGPVAASLATAQALRVLIRPFASRIAEFAAIAGISAMTLAAGAMAAPGVRQRLFAIVGLRRQAPEEAKDHGGG